VQNASSAKCTDVNVWLTKSGKRQEQNVTVDTAEFDVFAAADNVFASF